MPQAASGWYGIIRRYLQRRDSLPNGSCAQCSRPDRSEAQSLDRRRSEGNVRHRCPSLHFQPVHAQQPPRLHQATTEDQIFLLAADSAHVYLEQPVNTSIFAAPGCRPLIPEMFPQSNFRLLCSSQLGETCPYPADALAACFSVGTSHCRLQM
jgi:hypothetical protein